MTAIEQVQSLRQEIKRLEGEIIAIQDDGVYTTVVKVRRCEKCGKIGRCREVAREWCKDII